MTPAPQPSTVFRLAIAQSVVTLDVRHNGATIRALMAEAKCLGAKLVHFPEGSLTGYPGDPASKNALAGWPADWEAIAEEIALVARAAGQLGVWVVIGANHYNGPNRRPNNSLYVVDDSGKMLARYDKRLLSFTEIPDWYAAGRSEITFDVGGFRFGCALCIELQFSELFLSYERLGVDIMLVSSYSDDQLLRSSHRGTPRWRATGSASRCPPSTATRPHPASRTRTAIGQPVARAMPAPNSSLSTSTATTRT